MSPVHVVASFVCFFQLLASDLHSGHSCSTRSNTLAIAALMDTVTCERHHFSATHPHMHVHSLFYPTVSLLLGRLLLFASPLASSLCVS
jgi:hypothetical protein